MISMAVSDLTVIGQVGTTIGLGLLFDTLVVRSLMTHRWQPCSESGSGGPCMFASVLNRGHGQHFDPPNNMGPPGAPAVDLQH
jgi:hypothetical protein